MQVPLSLIALAIGGSASILVYVISIIIYRAFFHPLRKIPGPFIARITYFYIFKYNFSSGGSHFYLQVEKLHEKYGAVVRIAPNEVHLSDPENHLTIHRVGSKFTKDPLLYQNSFGTSLSAFSTESNELHRIRRAALSPLFTRARVLELEPIVQSKVAKFCTILQTNLCASKPTDISHAAHCISVDVITDYAFNQCYNLLELPDLGLAFFRARKAGQPRIWFNQQFPFMMQLLNFPRWVPALLFPSMARFMDRRNAIIGQIREIASQVQHGKKTPDNKHTIFHQLLDPNATEGYTVPPIPALADDAFIIVAAASETVGVSLTQAFWRCLSNYAVHARLMAELENAFPEPNAELSFPALEKLPYLTACLKESLRLAFALPGRLPRLVPAGGATFNSHFLPAGTSVSMSAWLSHRDGRYFPEPMTFNPDRWLHDTDDSSVSPEKVFAPFGRGSRICLGMTLAWSELYVVFGTVMRRFGHQIQVVDWIGENDFYPFDDYVSGWQMDGARVLEVVGKAG